MIYVDSLKVYRRQAYCHMISDRSTEELHTAAKQAGISKHWFHNSKRFPHYDLREEDRNKVLAQGAKEVSSKDLVRILKGLYNVSE